MAWVARSPISADPNGADLYQPDGSHRVVSVCTLDGSAWGGVCSVNAFRHLDVDYCSYVHYTSVLRGRAPRLRPRRSTACGGRRHPPGWPAHAAAPRVTQGRGEIRWMMRDRRGSQTPRHLPYRATWRSSHPPWMWWTRPRSPRIWP